MQGVATYFQCTACSAMKCNGIQDNVAQYNICGAIQCNKTQCNAMFSRCNKDCMQITCIEQVFGSYNPIVVQCNTMQF